MKEALDLNALQNGIHELIITDVNACQAKQFIQVIEDKQTAKIQAGNQIVSKKDHLIAVSKLKPTIITNDNNRFENNMVIMSDY